MAGMSLRLPESLHQAAREVAQQDGISIHQLVVSALGEKIAALRTLEYLQERAKNADDANWDKILARVPDVEAEVHDQL